MLTFHGDAKIKAHYVARLHAHQAQDEIVDGTYWSDGKGSAAGCILHSSDFIASLWDGPPAESPKGCSVPQDQRTSTHGKQSLPSAQTSRRRLNPKFVEWLMGWPLGWTETASIDPIVFASWETAFTRSLLQLHS